VKQSELESIADAVAKAITHALAPLQTRIKALEERPQVENRGVHIAGDTYTEGALVTRSGALWLCLRSTTQGPGQSADWKLIVKSGGAV
jgi:hypothetical protein